jgi:amino acid adenylation domain-containing protein
MGDNFLRKKETDFDTLVELIRWKAENQAERRIFTFLIDGEEEGPHLTYREIDRQSRAIGALLQSCTKVGDRVLLLYPPGLEFITAFFGCLYAGVMAVPAYPPRANRPMPRLQSIIEDAEAAVALTVNSIYGNMEKRFEHAPDLKAIKWIITDNIEGSPENQWIQPEINSDTIAFLQYTSGSTAAPKGVMVSHGNLLHNENMIKVAYSHSDQSTYVSWLPLFHDMGLIGNMIQCAYLGAHCVMMAPAAFLQKPYRWLQAITRYKAHSSGGPNFAYDLCSRMITPEQKATLDLSSWSAAFNGAEPIRQSTLELFARSFESCGFRKEAFYPCYGLAEATLFVTGCVRTEPHVELAVDTDALEKDEVMPVEKNKEGSRTLVGCGRIWLDEEVVIADPNTMTQCLPNRVGEVWIKSPSVAKGYWNRLEETHNTFGAVLMDRNEGPFLRTGDLGFLHDGELYITGRLKDLVIIRGRNHYPQDIELTVESCHEALRKGSGAAFSVDVSGEERLVIVQEVERSYRFKNLEGVMGAIRKAVSEEHELQAYSIVLIQPGSIPKTSSGKIQRRTCRAEYLTKKLEVVAEWTEVQNSGDMDLDEMDLKDSEDIKKWAIRLIASKVGISAGEIDLKKPLTYYGLDSLKAIELMHSFESRLQVSVSLAGFFEDTGIEQIIMDLQKKFREGTPEVYAPVSMDKLDSTEFPLSKGQRAIWFLHQLEPEGAAYNVVKAVKITSELDAEALERAFGKLTDRHAALSSTFIVRDGEPFQCVHDSIPEFFRYEDASNWSDAFLKNRLAEEVNRPFKLEHGPLFRVNLYKRSNCEHILLLSIHHIVIDFWSLTVLMNELGELYSAEKAGTQTDFPAIELQYSDYVHRQEQLLAGPSGEKLLNYWKDKLSGKLPPLNLPVNKQRPPVQTYNGASVPFKICNETTQRLKVMARDNGATLYMVLLAAFKTLLYRYTGQEDILVGSPTAGRDWAKLSNIVGYFVNPIVLRSKLSNDITFTGFLKEVKKTVLDAYEHQALPFALLVEHLQPQRDPSRSPIFQVMFVLQKAHLLSDSGLTPFALGEAGAKMKLGELDIESVALEQRTAQFDMTLSIAETNEGLTASLEYNTDLFEVSAMNSMAQHFVSLLENVVEEPYKEVSKLKILSSHEKDMILNRWNNTQVNYQRDACIHHLFEEQVKRVPDSTAVIFESESLTYRELNQKANKLANYLLKLGVGPEVFVGICMERSMQMIIGLLAILKAGGTYIPLDPSYPKDRLDYMAEDSKLSVLLTQESLKGRVSAPHAKVISLDTGWKQIDENEMDENPVSGVKPHNLAYIIFTSGSTGKPKGVQIPHGAVVNFLNSMGREPGLSEKDRLLSVTTISFDIAGLEIYLPLTRGACVVLAGREAAADGTELISMINNLGITVMQATPATWRLLIEAGWKGNRNLKVLCGGEALTKDLAGQLLKRAASVWNMYGPTETTIWSAVCRVEPDDGPITVGYPIDNTQIYILDANMQPVPVGVTGELYIGGDGLARGYLNRQELTREKFVPCPFSADNNARMYRTGDIARYMPDGRIEVLGRIDHQVKIRGFRIELGEIEAVLLKHPSICNAVVAANEVQPGDYRLVAYFIGKQGQTPANTQLRAFLKEELPEYMLPSAFVQMDAFPLTPNGKVDRRALPVPDGFVSGSESVYVEPRGEIEKKIAQVWKETLGVEKVGVQDNFFDLGGHSLLLAKVNNKLGKLIKKKLSMVDMYKYPTIQSLAKYITSEDGNGAVSGTKSKKVRVSGFGGVQSSDIAVIGISGRFPGAKNVEEFWNNLKNGVESIKFFTDEELLEAGIDARLLKNPNYVKARAILDDVEMFDAGFFGFSPKEAQSLDPQHRLFLECAWEVLDNSGYNSDYFPGKIGVFAGVGLNHYLLNVYSDKELIESIGTYQTFIGNDKDFVPTRVSYKLNLKGPSVNVQTACSSSLVAVHLGIQSLMTGESDIVLAGGVSIKTPQQEGYMYMEGGIPSSDGHCRAFDAKADGTVFGNGVGILALKRLDEAIEDGDHVYAVIKGSAVNNDGDDKVGYTAPSVNGQAEVIKEALEVAGVAPQTVTYIEAHGTGTRMGDPIEMTALKEAYGSSGKTGYCAVGSVKTNIGHLDTAAGAAGLIKLVMSLKNRLIPPSLNFEEPNPQLEIDESPFYINNRLKEWNTEGIPRRGGISSFGIGGTNAHIIVEEAPLLGESGESRKYHAIMLSAKTETALDAMTADLAAYMKNNPGDKLADIAYTLQVGRKTMKYKRMLISSSREDAVKVLETMDGQRLINGSGITDNSSIVFMFPGQGSQYVNMALEIYNNEPVFRESVDNCCKILTSHLGFDLRDVLYPLAGEEEKAAQKLQQTGTTQPVLFVIEYSMAMLWMSWGIKPQAMIGHSIGEYVAACIAGVFTLEDALSLVAVRGRLMQELPGGSMLAVSLSEKQVQSYLGSQLSLAAINGPSMCVVSGPHEAVNALEKKLSDENVACRRLHTSHAFHSVMMEPILTPFLEKMKSVYLKAPQIPYISNVTGTWITEKEAADCHYWVKHLRQTVRFSEGIQTILKEPGRIFMEIGPGQNLSTFVRQCSENPGNQNIITTIRHPQDRQPDTAFLLNAIGKLWMNGIKIDWSKYYENEKRFRIPLPSYPFQRRRYWLETSGRKGGENKTSTKRNGLDEWFYIPSWKKTMPPVSKTVDDMVLQRSVWMVFSDALGVGEKIIQRLENSNQDVIRIAAGETYEKNSESTYTINPGKRSDYDTIFEDLKASGRIPERILHLWSLTGRGRHVEERPLDEQMAEGFYSLLYLAQAIGKYNSDNKLNIEIITDNLQRVESSDTIQPVKATLSGPCNVIPQEYPNITTRCIDIRLPEAGIQMDELLEQLLAEFYFQSKDRFVSYRAMDRWTQTFEKAAMNTVEGIPDRLRQGGVYLITGGLGGIGLELAGFISKTVRAKIVLTGRTGFIEKEHWDSWLTEHDTKDETSIKINKLKAMEEAGSVVVVHSADVSDAERMKQVIAQVTAEFGAIHGIIHAAGVPGGGIIQLKKPEAAKKVLEPKVKGVINLKEALGDARPDFVVLCSSINAITGGFGQVDYAAANAFMDAFAQANTKRRGTFYLSVNWDRWNETGMAVSMGAGSQGRGMVTKIHHPLLEKCVAETLEQDVYSTEYTVEKYWVLSEHTVAGIPTLPGTSYLEMARAAFEKHAGDMNIDIRETVFMMPLAVREGEKREALTVLRRDREGYEFKIISRYIKDGKESGSWQEHVRGKLGLSKAEPLKECNVDQLILKCSSREIDAKSIYKGSEKGDFIGTGPRWDSLLKVYVGSNESLSVLEFPENYAKDFEKMKLHPAMLDVATGSVQRYFGEGNYLPLAYEKLTVKGRMSCKMYVYAKFKDSGTGDKDTITCDFSIMDENGMEQIEITGFTMKRIKSAAVLDIRGLEKENGNFGEDVWEEGSQYAAASAETLFDQLISRSNWSKEEGILTDDGIKAFKTILSACMLPQIVVSPKDPEVYIEETNSFNQNRILEEIGETVGNNKPAHESFAVGSTIAPGSDLEQIIASIWQKVLGVQQVGANDNFFDLGGTSLTGIQVISELKKVLNIDIPTVSIFEAPTVNLLAKLLSPEKDSRSFDHTRERANKKKEALERQKRLNREKRT